MNKKPVFSIIIAAYNVDSYIKSSIRSILQQSFDFSRVEVILVDDGSSDDTGKICDKYARKYPHNIKVLHQENRGVAAARNSGLSIASGKYINFLDGDDLLSKDTLRHVFCFFNSHESDIDITTIPLKYFGNRNENHVLNDKFNDGSRIVNLTLEPKIISLSASASFFKLEVLKSRKFDENLTVGEDAKLIQEILLENPRIGLLSESTYYYRSRRDGSSAMQSLYQTRENYIPFLQNFCFDLIRQSKERYNSVPRFIQYVLSYCLQWRLQASDFDETVMPKKDWEEYTNTILSLYDYIDDDIILDQIHIPFETRFMIMTKKKNCLPHLVRYDDDRVIFSYGKNSSFDLSFIPIEVEKVSVTSNKIGISGSILWYVYMEEEPAPLVVEVNGVSYEPIIDNKNYQIHEKSLNIGLCKKINFSVSILNKDMTDDVSIRFFRNSPFGLRSVKSLKLTDLRHDSDLSIGILNNSLKIKKSNYTSFIWKSLN